MPRCGMLVSRWGYLGSDGSIFVWSFVPQMVGLTPRGLCTLEGMGWHLCVELLKAQKKTSGIPEVLLLFLFQGNDKTYSALSSATWKSFRSVKISFLYGFFFCSMERLMIAVSTSTLMASARTAMTPCILGSAEVGMVALIT